MECHVEKGVHHDKRTTFTLDYPTGRFSGIFYLHLIRGGKGEESMTVGEIITAVLAVASAIVLLSNAAEKIAKAVHAAKKPNNILNDRVSDLEEWRKTVDAKQEADKKHLDNIDAGNRVTQLALLALLDHGIDGNNIDQMQHAKEELQSHLINR